MALNISEPQVVVHFPDDPNGLYWHHRILVKRIHGARWVTLTPDGDLEIYDLNVQQHIILDRSRDFPAPQRPFVYAFEEADRVTIRDAKRRATTMADVLGEGAADVEVADQVWVISEIGTRLGERVPQETVGDAELALLGDSKGVIRLEGEEYFAQRMNAADVEAFKKKKGGEDQDIRLVGDHRSPDGKRSLDLRAALSLFRETKMDDWPHTGPRAVKEFLTAVVEGYGSLHLYDAEWSRKSGVAASSAIAHEHAMGCEILRLAHSTDQLDLSNCACLEQVTRRIIQLECAVARNPRHPDFAGLDTILGSPVTTSGQAQVTTFNSWVTNQLKDRAGIMKQTRLYREEMAADGSEGKAGKKGKGKGRDGKNGRGGGGAADGAAPQDG